MQSIGTSQKATDEEFKRRTRLNLGTYQRPRVSNLVHAAGKTNAQDPSNETKSNTAQSAAQKARELFDKGLMHVFGFTHEEASKCFHLCLKLAPDCALAHGMMSLCHSPNYNFRGQPYYDSTDYSASLQHELKGDNTHDGVTCDMGRFPSQQMADYHSRLAMEKVDELQRTNTEISEVECQILSAFRIRTCQPGVDPMLADEVVGRPYADALRKVYVQYSDDPEVAFLFADSLMVLNAWNLYEFPTGRPLSPDVDEVQIVLEESLKKHPAHSGLCHLYVHLSEMSSDPGRALAACIPLRTQ